MHSVITILASPPSSSHVYLKVNFVIIGVCHKYSYTEVYIYMYGLLGICLSSCEDRYTLPCMHTHADSDDNHDKQVYLSLFLSRYI